MIEDELGGEGGLFDLRQPDTGYSAIYLIFLFPFLLQLGQKQNNAKMKILLYGLYTGCTNNVIY